MSFFFMMFFVAGCLQVPVDEVRGYRDAFAQARAAGDLVLDEVALLAVGDSTSESGANCAIDRERGYRPCFDLSFALGPKKARQSEPPLIAVRRLSLSQIDSYNALLTAMAEGRSSEALISRVDGVLDAANAAASLAGHFGRTQFIGGVKAADLAVEAFKPLIAKLESARASNAAANSVLAARSDIETIISLLISETPAYYELFLSEHKRRLRHLQLDRGDAQDEGETERIEEIDARLAVARDADHPNNPARAFEKALTGYVQSLDASKMALRTLEDIIRAPVNGPAATIETITRQTIAVEQFVIETREAIARFRAHAL